MGGVIGVAKAAIKVASSAAIGINLGGVARVAGAIVRVASSTAIKVSGGVVIRVASGTVIRVASSGGVASLFKIKLSRSYRATVIISLILIRAKLISLSVYL